MAEEDLIFGKNRHLFGGIEPSNMLMFALVVDTMVNPAQLKITAELPKDTVIDGQTLCTVAGAVIRRSTTNYPKDEFDGELVTDLKANGSFYDPTADENGTYYYAAFPYTAQGVYNRNPANRIVHNEPQAMVAFAATPTYNAMTESTKIVLSAQLPSGVAGAMIRRSTTGFPLDETSGDEITTMSTSGTYDDVDVVVGTKYYYAAFPFTSTGAYNRDESNQASAIATKLGGVEPGDMPTFNVALDSSVSKLKITAVLPPDIAGDADTGCTVAGAIIRRSTKTYPKDEFDGDLLIDLKEDSTFYDETADPTGTYYYAAFPYSIQGMYNRSANNRVVYNEPEGMVSFTSKSVYDATTEKAEIQLTAELPDGLVGAVIRKSTTGFPVDETDGDQFLTITTSGTYVDKDVEIGEQYYYSAFTFTTTGAHNYDEDSRTTVVAQKYLYFFGFDLDEADSNPATRVSYPSDVDNASYSSAGMNFTSDAFNYGDWPSEAGDKFMPKPCMLTYAGVVDQYLNQNNYALKEDGSASDVANTSFGGNAMMEWPKIYTKRWTENGVYKFRCCDIPLDDDYECWCNYDRNNNEIDHFYTPIYFGSNVSSKMRSISGQSNLVSQTAATEITYAKANGDDWYTEVVADRLLICDLLVLMGKTTAIQETFGYGYVGASSALAQGTMNTRGLFWGDDIQTVGVKVFGMENFWGNIWRRTAGWIIASGKQKMKLTRGTKDGSTATDYNTDGSGYKDIAGSDLSGTSGGYVKEMLVSDFGRIPTVMSGSATTYESDGAYFSATGAGPYYALVGGYWNHALFAGPFCAYLGTAATGTNSTYGAALSCKPLA